MGVTNSKGKDNGMSDLLNGAKESLAHAREKAVPAVEGAKEKVLDAA